MVDVAVSLTGRRTARSQQGNRHGFGNGHSHEKRLTR
jgi:hypothetical protein